MAKTNSEVDGALAAYKAGAGVTESAEAPVKQEPAEAPVKQESPVPQEPKVPVDAPAPVVPEPEPATHEPANPEPVKAAATGGTVRVLLKSFVNHPDYGGNPGQIVTMPEAVALPLVKDRGGVIVIEE